MHFAFCRLIFLSLFEKFFISFRKKSLRPYKSLIYRAIFHLKYLSICHGILIFSLVFYTKNVFDRISPITTINGLLSEEKMSLRQFSIECMFINERTYLKKYVQMNMTWTKDRTTRLVEIYKIAVHTTDRNKQTFFLFKKKKAFVKWWTSVWNIIII